MVKLNEEFLKKITLKKTKDDFFDVLGGITGIDVLLFLAFPAFISLVMLLPLAIRESLTLKIYAYSSWQLITHAFVHNELSHLWNNLKGYFIFGFILLIFANRAGEKKNLFLLFLFTLFSLPIISSMIEILIYPMLMPLIKTSQGSSALLSAMVGFFPAFWIYHFSTRQKNNLLNVNFFVLAFSYVAFLFSMVYYAAHKNAVFIMLVLAGVICSGFRCRKNLKLLLKGIVSASSGNVFFHCLTILMPTLFMIAPLLLFPFKIVQDNSIVDFFMHYIGLIYGMSISFIFLKWKFSDRDDNNA